MGRVIARALSLDVVLKTKMLFCAYLNKSIVVRKARLKFSWFEEHLF